jgi:hypothetical protein
MGYGNLVINEEHMMETNTSGISRIIIQVRDGPVQEIPSLLDVGHVKMLALGGPNPLYTADQAHKLDADAFAHFSLTTGLDFTKATVDTQTGIYYLGSIAMVAPFFIGHGGDYNVIYDSGKKTLNQPWTVRNNSWIVQFLSSGTFSAGTNAGQTYKPGDILSYGYTDHLKVNSHDLPNREQFIVYTQRPGNQPLNSYNLTEVHVPLCYVDANGAIGYGSDNVYKEMEGPSHIRQITQHCIIFFNTDQPT